MHDSEVMRQAIDAAASVRATTAPNPWVGCVIESASGERFVGATQPPGQDHAEVVALAATGEAARGGTAWVTLEPCSHTGRTGPCTDALIEAGIRRVVVAVEDPDPRVAGRGIAALQEAGIEVTVGIEAAAVRHQLRAYLTHRSTGRPWVVLKLAATIDGRTAAPDATSQWITGEPARHDAHRLRAESGAIIVGAGTVRADDPSLTVRHVDGPDPVRFVLGTIPDGAKVLPARSHTGALGDLLDDLGNEGVLQVLVEGGAAVASSFHRERLVDQYVIYLAPALFGGDDARPLFVGAGAPTMADLWRGSFTEVAALGPDLRVDLVPAGSPWAPSDDEITTPPVPRIV